MIVRRTARESNGQPRGEQTGTKKRSKPLNSQLAEKRSENGGSSESPLFRRDDWTLFRSLTTLGQRAGVPQDAISALVAKELADNALDAAGTCEFGCDEQGRFYVQNSGRGLEGTDADVGDLFSVARPLSSSKLLRLPTRGALGNGMRVVAGAVLASDGHLIVKTRGRALRLRPRDSDGHTDVERVGRWNGAGTRVEVMLGEALHVNGDTFAWVRRAAELANVPEAKSYLGKTSAWWYDSDSFYELCQAAGARTVRDLAGQFAGCSGHKAGTVASGFSGRVCNSLARAEAERLLTTVRDAVPPVNPKRLGAIGRELRPAAGYAKAADTFQAAPARGKLSADVPYIVEAWAQLDDRPSIEMNVNRTPITADVNMTRGMADKSLYGLLGCGLSSERKNTAIGIKAGRGREFSVIVNVMTPYMPITTDGKAPDLSIIGGTLRSTIEKAIRRAKRKQPGNVRQTSQAAIITESLPHAIDKASGKGQYRYSLRQLFYAVRPCVLTALGIEPDYGYFSKVVTECEAAQGGDLVGMYRDDRGTLYHPHTRETIPLGTRSVESYCRPAWTFNKILYCEKEGFFPILIDAEWPERHDCALLTSKGFASRAARDVLDLLSDSDQPLTFYCLHDADGPGTLIYQTLQEGTKARPGRRVEIINLGLEPAEAVALGLSVEQLERKSKKVVPVADYVDSQWGVWLQANRVELNAMDTPTFLKWLDAKMSQTAGKLIPPAPVLADHLTDTTRDLIREAITAGVIRSAGVEARTQAALAELAPAMKAEAERLQVRVRKDLDADPTRHWTAPVADVAGKLVAKA